ncbi:hypothetical protein ACP4OV_008171 [Aristida adscensionis]
MMMLHGTVPSVRPDSISHCKLACSAVYNSVEGHHVQKQHIVHSNKVNFTRMSHHLCKSLNERTTRHWMHRFHVNATSDDDFRSSRNIAITLFKRYKNVIDRGGGDNLREFISAGVNAYALGCTDEGLRKELMDIKDSGLEIEGLGSYGGGASLKYKINSSEVVSYPTCLSRRPAPVERILCSNSKRILYQRNGMVTGENLAAGTNGCHRKFGTTISSCLSDAEVSPQWPRV